MLKRSFLVKNPGWKDTNRSREKTTDGFCLLAIFAGALNFFFFYYFFSLDSHFLLGTQFLEFLVQFESRSFCCRLTFWNFTRRFSFSAEKSLCLWSSLSLTGTFGGLLLDFLGYSQKEKEDCKKRDCCCLSRCSLSCWHFLLLT